MYMKSVVPPERLIAFLFAFVALSAPAIAQGRAATQGARGNLPAPSSAKAKLADATAAAKKWKADAILIQVAGTHVGTDGVIPTWDYGFWSAAARTCLVVKVYVSGPQSVESGGPVCQSPELKDFMDSAAAMKIARSNGIKAPTAAMVATVVVGFRGGAARTTWSIMDNAGVKAGDVMLDIDATTGAVLTKTVQRDN